MKESSVKWLMAVSAVCCAVWAAGLGWTLLDYFRPVAASALPPPAAEAPAAPAPIPDDGRFRVLALGDSLTRGTGDPEGKGYVGYLIDELGERTEQEIVLVNQGVNGLTSPELVQALQREEVRVEARAADVLLVSIGGNDLFRGGETLAHLDPARIAVIEEEYSRQLQTILQELRKLNETATIFLIGLYNPFGDLQDADTTNRIVRDWNYRAAETAAQVPKAVLVPTFDLFQLQVRDYLAGDQFHPNAEGYRLIAERVAALITWREAEA